MTQPPPPYGQPYDPRAIPPQAPPPQQWQPHPQYGPPQQAHYPQQQGYPQQAPPPQHYPQQQWGPPVPQQPPGAGFVEHIRRALDWNVRGVRVSERERQQLVTAGVTEPRLQALFVWRRSSLMIALPVLLLSLVLAIAEAAQVDTDGFTEFGKLWNWFPVVGLLFLPIGALIAINRWTELRRTTRTLALCWGASIAIPVLTALTPLNVILDLEGFAPEEELALRAFLAVSYALTLLPVIITVPGGVVRGAARAKSLFPAALPPGWFLVTVAPFYSLFMVVVFVIIQQVVGNGLLLVGVALLAFAPWFFVIHRNIYTRPLGVAEADAELGKASRAGGYVVLSGLALIAVFFLTAEVANFPVLGSNGDEAAFTYLEITRTCLELFARGVVASVVFCLIFLNIVYRDWVLTGGLAPEVRAEHDAEMQILRRYADVAPRIG